MKFKILRAAVTAVLLIILCACSQPAAGPAETPSGSPAVQSSQNEPDVDITYLLSFIAESGKPLESFPALIMGADIIKDGYVLHMDRLEYNPGFEPGDVNDELYLLNESEKVEDIKTLDSAYAEYGAKTAEIGPEFLDYVSASETGMEFIVFLAGGEVVYLCEITVP